MLRVASEDLIWDCFFLCRHFARMPPSRYVPSSPTEVRRADVPRRFLRERSVEVSLEKQYETKLKFHDALETHLAFFATFLAQ